MAVYLRYSSTESFKEEIGSYSRWDKMKIFRGQVRVVTSKSIDPGGKEQIFLSACLIIKRDGVTVIVTLLVPHGRTYPGDTLPEIFSMTAMKNDNNLIGCERERRLLIDFIKSKRLKVIESGLYSLH